MLVSEVVSKARFYQTARQGIKNDKNLSPLGIERASKNLEESINLFRQQAYETLAGEWAKARAMEKGVRERRAQAERLESERWNYAKLQFETRSVETRLQAFHDVGELGDYVQHELSSGNLEHVRAVCDVVPAVVRSRFSGLDGEHVARVCERRLVSMLDTPDLVRVREMEGEGGKAVMNLMKDTQEVSDFFSLSDVFTGGNEFSKLLDNVRLTRTIHPDNPAHFETVSIEFTPEPVGV